MINCLVESLLNVFVKIEMTGEGVEFEEKFRYRRPMYAAMRYMDTEERFIEQFRVSASWDLVVLWRYETIRFFAIFRADFNASLNCSCE